jgi:hypothetical protein
MITGSVLQRLMLGMRPSFVVHRWCGIRDDNYFNMYAKIINMGWVNETELNKGRRQELARLAPTSKPRIVF